MAERKKNFYAVVKGRQPGIYTIWFGKGGAEEQVRGYAGAVYRGFATRAEADQFLRSVGITPPAAPQLFATESEPPPAEKRPGRPVRAASQGYDADLAAGRVVIFTDGASTGNPGPGGYGVVILAGKQRKEMSGGFRCTTNNRMELLGVITALKSLPGGEKVVIYSDSRYVVDAVGKGWARRWRARGWMRDDVNRAENADLWAQLLDLLDRSPVEFRWVRGHADNPLNERCDQMAVAAAHRPNLPADPGYQGSC